MNYAQFVADMTIMLAFLGTGIFMAFVVPLLFYNDWEKGFCSLEYGDNIALFLTLTLVVCVGLLFIAADILGWTKASSYFIAFGWTYAVIFMAFGMVITLAGCHVYIVGTAISRYGLRERLATTTVSMTVMVLSLCFIGYQMLVDSKTYIDLAYNNGEVIARGELFRMLIMNYDMSPVEHDGLIPWFILTLCFTSAMLLPKETCRMMGLKTT